MEEKEYSTIVTSQTKVTLNFFEIQKGLFFFKQTRKTTPISVVGKSKLIVSTDQEFIDSGIVTEENLENLINNKPYNRKILSLVSEKDLKKLRLEGYSRFVCNKKNVNKLNTATYDEYIQNEYTPKNLVEIDNGSHLIFDINGNILPTAIYCDYIKSRIDESSYDLEKLAEHLLARKDILIIEDTRIYDDEDIFKYKAKSVEDAIYSIPYYNAEEGRTKSINFLWQPNKKDFQKVWKACQRPGEKYPSCRIVDRIFDLDILDIKQYSLDK